MGEDGVALRTLLGSLGPNNGGGGGGRRELGMKDKDFPTLVGRMFSEVSILRLFLVLT